MLTINRNNREEIENEFMALMINKNELFEITQIRPQYLHNQKNAKIFEYCKECYDKYEVVNPIKILERHKDFDVARFTELMTEVLYSPNSWKEHLKISEESIVKFFKEDIINVLNKKLERKEITYDVFMKKMKDLDDIRLVKGSEILSREEIEANINNDKVKIPLNHFRTLDNYLSLKQQDFLVIGAATGTGKSGFMLNLMNDLMDRYQCIYFNIEMSKSTIYKRLISIRANMQIKDIESPQTDYQRRLIDSTIDEIEKAELIIEHSTNDLKQIKNVLTKYKSKNKHTIIFVDHMGLLSIDNAKSLYEQTTAVAKELRQMCLEYDCTIISASQLNRENYKSEKASIYMLKDSGELENSASKIILLYKKDKEDKNSNMIIDLAKNREGIQDVTVEMEYDRPKQVFREIKNY